MSRLWWTAVAVALTMAGSMTADTRHGSRETLWIDSVTAECVGVGPQTCLRVKRVSDEDWQLFYDSITGFDYEEGYAYEIVVRVTERPDPPADASSLLYELVEVTSKQVAGAEAAGALTDHAWQLESFADPQAEVAAGAAATLEFDGDASMAHGTGGCNRYAGAYEAAGASLTFGIIRSTMMACPDEPRSHQEQAFLQALESVAQFGIEGGRLQLLDQDGELLMTLAPRPDLSLTGIDWRATAVNNGSQAVVSVNEAGIPTARFDGSTISGSGGCNQYTATFEVGDGTIEIGPAAATRKMCAEAGVMDQEIWFFAALQSAATFTIDRDELELRTASGALAVSFRAD